MNKNFQLSNSPFADNPENPQVWVSGGNGAYANTREALSYLDLSPAAGKSVLLKPNAGRIAKAGMGVTTEPQVMAAAADVFREAGAQVSIGESPISGVDTLEAFEETGIAAIARERDCPLIDMDARRFVKTALPEGIAIQSLMLCPEMLEFDLIVSVPVMKMHMHTRVTLAVKNMKGCLWQRSKVKLHMLPVVPEFPDEKSIDVAIADMSWALRPHLSIIDGTVGMEGLGPSAGQAKPLDVVVVGADAFAADAVACRLMGISAAEIPHLRLGAERGYGILDLNRIQVEPGNWESLAGEFARPPENIAIEFPDITILDRNSCSACQSTLLLFLKRYGKELFDYFKTEEINIAIGKGHDDVPEGSLCLGNCVLRHREKGIFVPGCPPVSSEILSALSGAQEFDVHDAHSETPEKIPPRLREEAENE